MSAILGHRSQRGQEAVRHDRFPQHRGRAGVPAGRPVLGEPDEFGGERAWCGQFVGLLHQHPHDIRFGRCPRRRVVGAERQNRSAVDESAKAAVQDHRCSPRSVRGGERAAPEVRRPAQGLGAGVRHQFQQQHVSALLARDDQVSGTDIGDRGDPAPSELGPRARRRANAAPLPCRWPRAPMAPHHRRAAAAQANTGTPPDRPGGAASAGCSWKCSSARQARSALCPVALMLIGWPSQASWIPSRASNTSTSTPALCRPFATHSPPRPAPTTTTRISLPVSSPDIFASHQTSV